MTKKQLLRFVAMRNRSEFDSNLQVQCDASTCGFEVSELGPGRWAKQGTTKVFEWATPYGKLTETSSPYAPPKWELNEA